MKCRRLLHISGIVFIYSNMIQRIQSIYLLGVTILFTLMLFLPIGSFLSASEEMVFKTFGIYSATQGMVYSTWSLTAISSVIALLSLFTIFLFKRRMLQIRLTIFSAVLAIGFYLLYSFYVWILTEKLVATWHIDLALSLPFAAIVLNWLAIRSIGADEALVRSLSRIR